MKFLHKLTQATQDNNSMLCIGLDPNLDTFPKHFKKDPAEMYTFITAIVDATVDLVCCYKFNSAFFEAYGANGLKTLKESAEYVRKKAPHIPIILDAKRGDIGNTNQAYVRYAFEYIGADSVTIQPYQGVEAVAPFFADQDKAVFVLAKTSNPDSSAFQNIKVGGARLYEKVIQQFLEQYPENCFFVAGATYPDELRGIRTQVGDAPLLVPGVGAQGGSVADMVPAGVNGEGHGLIINSSRAILYASDGPDFAKAAREAAQSTKDAINTARKG